MFVQAHLCFPTLFLCNAVLFVIFFSLLLNSWLLVVWSGQIICTCEDVDVSIVISILLQQQENQLRISRGEAPLPDEDINKIFKPLQPPPRLDSLLIAGQIDNYCQQISEFSAQSFGKLFMAESLQSAEKTNKS